MMLSVKYLIIQSIVLLGFIILSLKISIKYFVEPKVVATLGWILLICAIISIGLDFYIIVKVLVQSSGPWICWPISILVWGLQKLLIFRIIIFPFAAHAPPSNLLEKTKQWSIKRVSDVPKKIFVRKSFYLNLKFTPCKKGGNLHNDNYISIPSSEENKISSGPTQFAINYNSASNKNFEFSTRYPLLLAPQMAVAQNGLYEQVMLAEETETDLHLDVKFLKPGVQIFELFFYVEDKGIKRRLGRYREIFNVHRSVLGIYVPAFLYKLAICIYYLLFIFNLIGGVMWIIKLF